MHAIGVQRGRAAPWLSGILVRFRNIKYIKHLNWHINTPNLERKLSDDSVLGNPCPAQEKAVKDTLQFSDDLLTNNFSQ